MTEYVWDLSHYDGAISRATLAAARAEGIAAIVHKIGEGADPGLDDRFDNTVLGAARDEGFPLLGGYQVVRSGPAAAQVDELLALADRDERWWRTFPGWFWMVDLERWPYDPVPAATGISVAQLLRQRTGRQVLLYASRGQYGDTLTGWDGPLWNACYVTGSGPFTALYPGDSWAPGWAPYSGQTPALVQFSSSATIAGLTRRDVSAFRGSLTQLTTTLTGSPTRGDTDMLRVRISGLSGQPEASQGHIHIIASGTGLWYVQDASHAYSDAHDKAGAPAIVALTAADFASDTKATYGYVMAELAGPPPAPAELTDDQVAALAQQLAAALPTGVTAAELEQILRSELGRTRLTVDDPDAPAPGTN